ncbi:MAG: hypothetical protein LBR23_03315 [Spirochaetaceae bacterium]|jgi:transcriptional regulator of met regulon|nr:hypothetical protein [Spirochaetaceae bacterium]
MYEVESKEPGGEEQGTGGIGETQTSLGSVTKFFEDTPDPVFDNPNYYKIALGGEKESAGQLHAILSKFLTSTDIKEKNQARLQVTAAYWGVVRSIALKMASPDIPKPKRFLLRFGIVSPSLLTAEQKRLFATIIQENAAGEPVFYLDEWLAAVASGELERSDAGDGRPQKPSGPDGNGVRIQRLAVEKEKYLMAIQTGEGLLRANEARRSSAEAELRGLVDILCAHEDHPALRGHTLPLSEAQKQVAAEIAAKVRQLLQDDRETGGRLRELQGATESYEALKIKMAALAGKNVVDDEDIVTEVTTVSQMAMITAGRQGNHFPVLSREFFKGPPENVGTRENVLAHLAWLESVDPGAFCRSQKSGVMRIVPYVLLLPTYGDTGLCWEPFSVYNRASSRGRIVVPMYPKNLREAVIAAVGDLRWQVAKENAGRYWMEEGLTGEFYCLLSGQKIKGNVKDAFVEHYTMWLTKESEGVPRMDKDMRSLFWRYIPFTEQVKERLKTRSAAYNGLFQRDKNRGL